MKSHSEHDLYKQGDKDAPSCVRDANGDVVLGLCRRCGRGERELSQPCIPHSAPPDLAARMAAAPRLHDDHNPLWRGPYAEGPLGGITQSMIGRFLSCRDRFRIKFIHGLDPADKWNHKLGFGNMWHACEEALAKGERWDTFHQHVYEQFDRYPTQRDEIEKWANVCRVQFPEYVKYWTEHPDVKNRTPLLQEEIFDVPYTLPSGRVVRLRGRWDSVDMIKAHTDESGRQWPDGIWLQENKTKGRIDKIQIERQLSFDLQTMMYIIALSTYQIQPKQYRLGGEGIPRGLPILGVRYNVIRRPFGGGVGNISPHKEKATKTTFTPAETSEQFYERLRRDYIAADPAYWFFRVRAEITDRDVKVFKDTCLDPLLETICCWYEQITTMKGSFNYIGQKHSWVCLAKEDRGPGTWQCTECKNTTNDNDYWRDESICPRRKGVEPKVVPMNYRTPFGIYNALQEGGATEYDAYLDTGSEAGLRRVQELFTELK